MDRPLRKDLHFGTFKPQSNCKGKLTLCEMKLSYLYIYNPFLPPARESPPRHSFANGCSPWREEWWKWMGKKGCLKINANYHYSQISSTLPWFWIKRRMIPLMIGNKFFIQIGILTVGCIRLKTRKPKAPKLCRSSGSRSQQSPRPTKRPMQKMMWFPPILVSL